jgi:mannosyltransferase OCH1-like enzyme
MPDAVTGEIPRTIHQIFFGGESAAPPDYRRYAETWRHHHPDWKYEFWDAARCRALIADHYPAYLEMYDRYRHRIQRVDAVRYFLLHHHGGVYLDMDIECLKPIDELVAGRQLLFGAEIGGYSNAVMGSVAGHPLWPPVFEKLKVRQPRFGRGAPLWSKLTMPMHVGYSTGPILLGDCLRESGYEKDPAVRICPTAAFEPLAPREDVVVIPGQPVDLSQSYAIHHMSMHWLPRHHKVIFAAFEIFAKFYWRRRAAKKASAPS